MEKFIKKNILLVIISIIILIILLIILLFSFGSGTKEYYSNNTNLNITIPLFSLFAKEYKSGTTYTVEFVMVGSEEHIQSELNTIFEINKNNNVHVSEWVYTKEGIYKRVSLVYDIG